MPSSSSHEMDPADRKAVLSLPGNTTCVECEASEPDWASVTYGTLLCLTCSGLHRGLGVHLSFVRSLRMDSWTDAQVESMKLGGNGRFREYMAGKGFGGGWAKEKYESEAAAEYREELKGRVEGGGGGGVGATAAAATAGSADDGPSGAAGKAAGTAAGRGTDEVVRPEDVFREVDRPMSRLEAFVGAAPVVFDYFVIGGYGGDGPPAGLRSPRGFLTAVLFGSALFWGMTTTDALVPRRYRWAVRALGAAAVAVPAIKYLAALTFMSRLIATNRQRAYNSARNLLLERIRTGRAERRGRYDLYLPPPPPRDSGGDGGGGKPSSSSPSVPGLIFVPGGMVEHTAYAVVASALSDEGVVVAVMNLEPLRVIVEGATHRESNLHKDALRVLYDVTANAAGFVVSEWAVGGHSMGATAANNLAVHMKPGVSKLVICGSAKPRVLSLREGRGRWSSPTDVLVVNATEDAYANMTRTNRPEEYEKFKASLPPEEGGASGSTRYVLIEGGNHSGFGHYGPQLKPLKDGDRTITLEEQQRIFVRETANFLLGRGGDGSGGKAKKD